MNLLYLAALVVSITGMVVLDVRFRLFFAAAPVRAAIVLVLGVGFFLAWDVAGITLGIFFRGNPDLLTGILLAPELPLEELFFLILLCYTTMNAYAAMRRVSPELWRPTPGVAGPQGRFGRKLRRNAPHRAEDLHS